MSEQLTPELVTNPELHLASVRARVKLEEIRGLFDSAFPKIFAALGKAGIAPASAPLGVTHGEPGESFDMSVAVPVAVTFVGDGEVHGETIPEGRAARLLALGSYDGLGAAYGKLYAWIEEQGLVPTGLAWEEYLTEPEPDGDASKNETMLWVQVSQPVEP